MTNDSTVSTSFFVDFVGQFGHWQTTFRGNTSQQAELKFAQICFEDKKGTLFKEWGLKLMFCKSLIEKISAYAKG
jgi:hypothetical protein